jgi:hypothetical protein
MSEPTFGDLLNSIYWDKVDYTTEGGGIKNFVPFVFNRLVSMHTDCIGDAYQMTLCHDLPADMQYHYYLHSLCRRRRFAKLPKKETSKDIEFLRKHYQCNYRQAIDAAAILTVEDIEELKALHNPGTTFKKD